MEQEKLVREAASAFVEVSTGPRGSGCKAKQPRLHLLGTGEPGRVFGEGWRYAVLGRLLRCSGWIGREGQ